MKAYQIKLPGRSPFTYITDEPAENLPVAVYERFLVNAEWIKEL